MSTTKIDGTFSGRFARSSSARIPCSTPRLSSAASQNTLNLRFRWRIAACREQS